MLSKLAETFWEIWIWIAVILLQLYNPGAKD